MLWSLRETRIEEEEEEEGRLCFSVDEDLWDQDYEILG